MNEEVLDIEEDLDDEWEEDDWEDDSVKADFSLFEKKDYIDAVKFFYQHNGGWFYCGKLGQDFVAEHDDYDWKDLFEKYSAEDWITKDEEKRFYESLPDEITVYRGGTSPEGISWTTNYFVARYFAYDCLQYRGKDTDIFKKTIKKSDIRAVLMDMDECEVILC